MESEEQVRVSGSQKVQAGSERVRGSSQGVRM